VPGNLAQIGGDETGLRGLRDVLGIVVAGDDLDAPRLQRVTARKARTAEPEHRDRLARKGGDGDHDLDTVIPGWSDLSAVARRAKGEGPDPESRDSLVRNCAP